MATNPTGTIKQAGHYELKTFTIYNYQRTKKVEMKMVIHNFNIVESMASGTVYGSALIFETEDYISKFPFVGEELIEIQYSDFFDKVRTETYFVYAIDTVDYGDEKSASVMKYMIHFVSAAKFTSEDSRVEKAYKPQTTGSGLVSDYVKDVYKEYYKKTLEEIELFAKEIVVEDTFGPQTFVIPRLTPEQTMHFFARKAYSAENKSQTFRFFENRDKYYFATNEHMLELGMPTAQVYTRNYKVNMLAERQLAAMNEFIDINFNARVNTIEDINMGGYKRKVYEVDMMNNAVTETVYNHLNEYKEMNLKLPHSKEFADSRMTKYKERFVMKDYSSVGAPTGNGLRPNPYYVEVYNYKYPYFYHYGRNSIDALVYGRNDLVAGGIIKIDLEVHKADLSTSEPDVDANGYYFIESIENIFYENTYRQKLVLSRGGIGQ